jgi:ectoine hydroxylase-related dioxygenase (phytanoyl-CoA dioxygenase family)
VRATDAAIPEKEATMLEHFSAEAPVEDVIAAVDRDGAAVLDGLLAAEQVDALAGDFQPHLDSVPWCNTLATDHDEFFGLKTKRLRGLAARSKRFSELIALPRLVALAEHRLLPHARDLRLSTGELMALGGGESEQALHRDADSWHHAPRPRPEILFSANVALTDFRLDNGATVVVPGSHRWPLD